jgi:glycosyltransferase involved in cell wall biosynthesis
VKVAVYTIALNEAANAEHWAKSAVDADYRIVADTGSTDDTVERLTSNGVTVHRIAVRPWRFDVARNTAMALIPSDVDVCCTMDMHRFLEPGWRPLKQHGSQIRRHFLPYALSIECRRSSTVEGLADKEFPPSWGYRFRRPVHEELAFSGEQEVTSGCDDILMWEVQDHTKPRGGNTCH